MQLHPKSKVQYDPAVSVCLNRPVVRHVVEKHQLVLFGHNFLMFHHRQAIACVHVEYGNEEFVRDARVRRDIEMGRVLNGLTLIGIQVCFDTAYPDEPSFLLDQLQHALNGIEEMRVYDFPVIHECMREHEMTFRCYNPIIEMPWKSFGHEQIPDRLKVWLRQKLFVDIGHELLPRF